MSKKNRKLDTTDSSEPLSNNPFTGLDLGPLPVAKQDSSSRSPSSSASSKPKSRGRLDVIRQRSGGGGGWSTVVTGFKGISQEEKNDIKKRIQKRCGVGGAIKSGNIEIQGDKREEVKAVLEAAGFKVVFAGG